MSGGRPANEAERRRWNDARRYESWPRRERLTDEVTPLLLDALAPTPGERLLDVGSGGGRAAFAAAAAVAPGGEVVGVDISAGLLRLARERAAAGARANVRFVQADAQTDPVDGSAFDAAMSQFGVMFFDEPVTAFRNIHAQLVPGGRIAFACWQERDANPWYFSDAVADLLPPAREPEPGKSAPGPFTLAEPARTQAILEAAGFVEVERQAHELEVVAPEDSVADEAQLVLMGIPEDHLPEARSRMAAAMRRFRIDDELSRFPIAFQIFTARRP